MLTGVQELFLDGCIDEAEEKINYVSYNVSYSTYIACLVVIHKSLHP